MREWTKILVSSTVVASVVSAIVSWLTSAQTIQLERWSRQGESAYDVLINANAASWIQTYDQKPAPAGVEQAAAGNARTLDGEARVNYFKARLKIAVYGSAGVVRALSHYDRTYLDAGQACANQDKFKADVRIYREIRNSLGVGGPVSDNDLAAILFSCSLS